MDSSANKTKCNCCDHLTIDGLSTICPVCFWQRDEYQEEHQNDSGGPNLVALIEAKKNYKAFGSCEEKFKDLVRSPLASETVNAKV